MPNGNPEHSESDTIRSVIEQNWDKLEPRDLNEITSSIPLLSPIAMAYVWGKFMCLTLQYTRPMLGNYFAADLAMDLSYAPEDPSSLHVWAAFKCLNNEEKLATLTWVNWAEKNFPAFEKATENLRIYLA